MAEKGIDIETVQVDLAAQEQFSDAYRRINPDCVVPSLQLDDGSVISEVVAICHYLEAKHPDPPLLGSSDEERARVLMWNTKVEQQGLLPMADAFRNRATGLVDRALPGPESYAQIPALAERGRQRVQRFFEKLEQRFAGSVFIAGDNFSIADISALVVVDFAAWIKLRLPEDAPHVRRWYDSVSGRPSAAA